MVLLVENQKKTISLEVELLNSKLRESNRVVEESKRNEGVLNDRINELKESMFRMEDRVRSTENQLKTTQQQLRVSQDSLLEPMEVVSTGSGNKYSTAIIKLLETHR